MAAPQNIRTALLAIETALQGIDGTGNFNFDLSDFPTDRVQITWLDQPKITGPSIQISGIGPSSSEHGPTLGNFLSTPSILIRGFIGSPDGTYKSRLLRAGDFLEDVWLAIRLKLRADNLDGSVREILIGESFEVGVSAAEGGIGVGFFVTEISPQFTHFPCV